jgi:hypothetical protein
MTTADGFHGGFSEKRFLHHTDAGSESGHFSAGRASKGIIEGRTIVILLICLMAQDFTGIDSGNRWAKPGEIEHTDRITDEATLKTLWERLPSSQMKKDMPKVDFIRSMLLAVIPSLESDRKQLMIDSIREEKGIRILT